MLSSSHSFWFAIQVKYKQELSVSYLLRNKGYEEFTPTYKNKVDQYESSKKPLFPGYVFCRFDHKIKAPVVTTPGVIRIVGYGGSPARICDSEIEAIRTIQDSQVEAKPCQYLAEGERVLIRQGPLRGLEGTVVHSSQQTSLVVSVTLLRRSVAVTINQSWV